MLSCKSVMYILYNVYGNVPTIKVSPLLISEYRTIVESDWHVDNVGVVWFEVLPLLCTIINDES